MIAIGTDVSPNQYGRTTVWAVVWIESEVICYVGTSLQMAAELLSQGRCYGRGWNCDEAIARARDEARRLKAGLSRKDVA